MVVVGRAQVKVEVMTKRVGIGIDTELEAWKLKVHWRATVVQVGHWRLPSLKLAVT